MKLPALVATASSTELDVMESVTMNLGEEVDAQFVKLVLGFAEEQLQPWKGSEKERHQPAQCEASQSEMFVFMLCRNQHISSWNFLREECKTTPYQYINFCPHSEEHWGASLPSYLAREFDGR
jgi:hypothetical protein